MEAMMAKKSMNRAACRLLEINESVRLIMITVLDKAAHISKTGGSDR
jgi:hypothetical protein